MRRITDDDPYYADELHKQFLSVDSVYFLTGEEQKWLSEHGEIKIGYLINDGGVSTLDKDTKEMPSNIPQMAARYCFLLRKSLPLPWI